MPARLPIRLFGLLAFPLLLAGCDTLDGLVPSMPDIGMPSLGLGGDSSPVSQPAKITGLAVSDEPFAARAGAAILTQGGSAADAATAMFFTLSATYPVAAGLGGGGICIVRDAGGRASEYDFLPHAANEGGAYAVPGAVAGFYDLQKAYGALPWQRDVAPGEAFAATGFPISHVLAQRLAAAQAVLHGDAALSAEFLSTTGQLKPEGSVVANPNLSVTLGNVRQFGRDGFYTGSVAAGIAAASNVSTAELAGYRSSQVAARRINLGSITALVPGPSTGAGAFSDRVLAGVRGNDLATAAVAAVRAALAGFNIQSVPPDLGATGFAALDASGQSVACAMTLNGPFGSGHSAGDTGVMLAASPSTPAGISSAFLTPVIAADNGGQVAMAGVGAGGPNGTGAVLYALMHVATGQGLGRPGDLRSTGLAPFATVNAIACSDGLCVALPDPGGNGLGASVGE